MKESIVMKALIPCLMGIVVAVLVIFLQPILLPNQEIRELKEQLNGLQSRISAVEGRSATAKAAVTSAEGPLRDPEKPECLGDVSRLCVGMGSLDLMEVCLQDRFDQVSTECREQLQKSRDLFSTCQKDIEKHCSNAGYGGGRMARCLAKVANLSKECRVRQRK